MSSVNEPSTKSTRIDVMSKTTTKISQNSYDTSSIKDSSTKPNRPTTLNSRPNTNKKTSQKTFRPSPTGQLPGSDHDSRKVTTVYDMSSVNEPSTKSTTLHIMSKTAIKTSPTSLRHESSTVQLASTKPSHPTTLHSLPKTNKKMPQKTVRPGSTGQLPGSDHDSMKTTTFSLATKSTRSTTSDVRSKNNRKTSQKTLLRSSPTVQMPSIDSDSNETTIALCIVLPIILGLLFILLVGLFCRRRKRNHRKLKISSHENRGKKTDPRFETPDVNVNMKEINGDHSRPVDQDIADTTQTLVRHSNQDDQCVIVEANPIYDASHVELINQTPDFKKKEIAGDNFHSDPDCESPDGKSWADDEDILDTTETLSSDFNPDDQSVVVMSNPIYEAPEVNAPVEEKKDDSLSSYQLQPEWKTSELKYKEIDDANFHPNSENTEHESAD
ncbi:uncharacterized protein LOC114530622 [Dendronephthya gigantea]|uniref:uncharacterized protein LOC114530622 n=1 Tax=Dendronephthya gigantea TaxID=151771 RepID=UPI00106BD795|nr:uncharacterized protein LOC114530622 [Dendronephthya gigantea]